METQEIEKLKSNYALVRSALVGIVGTDKEDELNLIEVIIRNTPAPAKDKAATIDAIHALKATL